MNNFDIVKQAAPLAEYAADKLERRGRLYICPVCGSGTGQHKTPAFSIKGDRWHCFACGNKGDIFDLAAIVEDIDVNDRTRQLEIVAAWANCPIDEAPSPTPRPKTKKQAKTEQPRAAATPDYEANRQREADYIETCKARINEPCAMQYLTGRGFTEAEIHAYGFGYDPKHPQGWKDNAGQWHHGGRIIIPWLGSNYYHIDRAISPDADAVKYCKPNSELVGRQPLYNPDALKADAFFIVEGALDALAIKACGYEAIALMGINNTDAEQAIADNAKGAAIVLTDSDERGDQARARILKLLRDRCRFATECRIDGHKDASEWLAIDREALKSFLKAVYDSALAEYQEYKENVYSAALERFRVKNPLDIATSLYVGEYYEKPTPTGIEALDRALGGGLKTGLYVMGAGSSIGKTTLALQACDNIAKSGRGVLFVTIEQSAAELTAKSLSRYIYTLSDGTECISAARIMQGASALNLIEQQELAAACNAYGREVSPKLKILEGIKQPKVEDIKNTAAYIADHEGQPPVIVIDYLQLLAASSDRDTDKQATDRNVMELRQLSRDMKTPVFVISSLNRGGYHEGVTMEAFKESGSIEYSADVLMGLQPKGISNIYGRAYDERGEKAAKRAANQFIRKFKSEPVRDCEITILKNRNGSMDDKDIPIKFVPAYSIFTEGKGEKV